MTRASIFGPVFALGLPRQIEVSRPEGCGSLRSEFGDGVTYFTLLSRSRVLHSGAIAAHRHTRRTGVCGHPFAIFAPPVLLASSSSWVSSVCPREKPDQMRLICENQRAAWLPLCPVVFDVGERNTGMPAVLRIQTALSTRAALPFGGSQSVITRYR